MRLPRLHGSLARRAASFDGTEAKASDSPADDTQADATADTAQAVAPADGTQAGSRSWAVLGPQGGSCTFAAVQDNLGYQSQMHTCIK